MNQEQARNIVRQTLTQGFDKTRFQKFVLELLNEFDESKEHLRIYGCEDEIDAFTNQLTSSHPQLSPISSFTFLTAAR